MLKHFSRQHARIHRNTPPYVIDDKYGPEVSPESHYSAGIKIDISELLKLADLARVHAHSPKVGSISYIISSNTKT